MPITDLAATVVLAGNTQSGHIRATSRSGNLIKVGHSFSVVLDPEATPEDVGSSVTITEAGQLVLTGKVDKVEWVRDPDNRLLVSGRDEYWRAQDWYLEDPNMQAAGESVSYWVSKLCNLCGLAYTITAIGSATPVGSARLVLPLGHMNIDEALKFLCSFGGWSMRVLATGVLEFFTVDTGTTDEAITQWISGNHQKGDAQTRNVAKVWGYDAVEGESLFYKQRVDIPGITPDRIMLISSTQINSLPLAAQLASRLLDHFGNLDEMTDVITVGNSARLLGQVIEIELESGQTQLSPLTDLDSGVDSSGYNQSLAIGRKNFALPYGTPEPIDYTEWEDARVLGEANDCKVFGDYIYSAGYSYTGDGPNDPRVWRVECHQLYGGALIWAVNRSPGGTLRSISPSHFNISIWGIEVTFAGVYVIGNYYSDPGSPSALEVHTAVELWDANNGSLIWHTEVDGNSSPSARSDLIVNGTTVWACVTTIVQVGAPTAYHITSGAIFYPLDPSDGTLGVPVIPTVDDPWVQVFPQAGIIDDPLVTPLLANTNQIYQGPDGGWLFGGRYKKIIGVASSHLLPPFLDITYNYFGQMWFGYFDASGAKVWEVLEPYVIGTTGTGNIYSVAVDLVNETHFRGGPDETGLKPPYGGLARYTNTNFDWVINMGWGDVNGHIEIGNYCYTARGAYLQWFAKLTGAYLGERHETDTNMNGLSLYEAGLQVGLCGKRSRLFWTALWNQPG